MTEQQSIQSAGLLLPLAGGEAKAATSFCLIVDDEKGIRNLIARSLRNHLVMTEGCGDASSALDALKLRTPDLIFLDISLERSDAIEVIRGLGEMKFDGAVQLMSGRDLRSLEEIKRVGEKHKLRMLPVLRKPFRGDLIPGILRDAGIAPKEPRSADAAIGLFEALCAGWVDLCYQPKIELRSGKIAGAEGLVRIVHPTRGVLPPGSVLTGADEASLVALAECALQRAMIDWPAFAQAGNRLLRLSVNVPMIALQKLSIAAIVREHRPQDRFWPGLVLEVSEDQILSDLPLAHEIAAQLRLYNIELAVDRSGKGCAGLVALGELPFVELKISSGLVSGCAVDPNQALLCKAVIDLAHQFGRIAVAEGVDKPDDLVALTKMGCDLGQGSVLSKALSMEKLAAVIAARSKNARGF
jgi:EAL domain-containing protein (putative c-di-GMP-specific phosphodiesterase class I)